MNDKQHYELMFIVPAKFAGEELSSIKDKVKNLLAQHGGEITKETDMGRRRMAYPINHVYQGFYFVMEFDVISEELEKIYTALKLMPEVLRYMVVSKRILSERELEAEAKFNAAVRAELVEKGVIKEGRKFDDKREDTASREEKLEEVVEEKKEEVPVVEAEKIAEAPEELKEEVKEEDPSKVKLEELNENLDDIISDDINELL